jgi:RNA ligase (TIGR02306 family)
MNNVAIVTRIKNVRQHPNADKVKLATCHGNQVVVGLDVEEGHLGVYFQDGLQLSHEFCHANNLYREASLNKFPEDKGGMFDSNRRVRAQKFRGEISDGFWVPLHQFGFIQVSGLDVEGFEFDEWCGVHICNKYVNPNTIVASQQNKNKKAKVAKTSVMFKEHFDTEHFGKYLDEFKNDEQIIITEKLHGTSGRVAHVLIDRELTWKDKLANFIGAKVKDQDWGYLNGTRRVVLEETSGSQYHDPTIREIAFNKFKDNLRKGETVYFEIVGFETTGTSIMPSVDVTKLNDSDLLRKYGNLMYYSYGCAPRTCEIYVYRITITNDDGQSVDLCWNDVKSRCGEIGVKHVPEIANMTVNSLSEDDRDRQEELLKAVDAYAQGDSLLDNRHLKEGVCVRIDHYGIKPKVYKHKSFNFKVLEGIIKDSGVVDTEEAQG